MCAVLPARRVVARATRLASSQHRDGFYNPLPRASPVCDSVSLIALRATLLSYCAIKRLVLSPNSAGRSTGWLEGYLCGEAFALLIADGHSWIREAVQSMVAQRVEETVEIGDGSVAQHDRAQAAARRGDGQRVEESWYQRRWREQIRSLSLHFIYIEG